MASITAIAHPAKSVRKELADIVDAMVVQTVDHGLDHGAGLVCFAHVRVARQHGLFGSGTSHQVTPVMSD